MEMAFKMELKSAMTGILPTMMGVLLLVLWKPVSSVAVISLLFVLLFVVTDLLWELKLTLVDVMTITP